MAYEDKGDKGKAWVFDNQYHESGDNKPVKSGNGEISRTFLKLLIEEMKRTGAEEITLDFAAWEQTSKSSGKPYLFFTFGIQDEKYKKKANDGPDGSGGDADEKDPFSLD